MSTFPGLIEEVPGISVDRFNGDNFHSSVFFLSHCHTDHMEGLNLQFFQHLYDRHQYLYCTPISKLILINIYNLNENLVNNIRTIDGCAPIVINYNYNCQIFHVMVACIPAGHCPGSVMFIFEINQNCVLYTGDFRIDVDDFSKLKPLHYNINDKIVPKKFDTIYLDTTFFNSDFKYFPSRQKTLYEICKVMRGWISQNERHIVVLECSANYGSENLFIEISNALGIPIHVKDKVFKSYTFIPELANCITNDPYASRIHACMNKNTKARNGIGCRSDVELKNIITVVPSAYRWKFKDLSKNISEWDENEKRFYACYSSHSSYNELEAFIKYFSPDKLYPCVCPSQINFEDFQNQLNQILIKSNKHMCNNYSLNFSRYKLQKKIKKKTLNLSDDDDDDNN